MRVCRSFLYLERLRKDCSTTRTLLKSDAHISCTETNHDKADPPRSCTETNHNKADPCSFGYLGNQLVQRDEGGAGESFMVYHRDQMRRVSTTQTVVNLQCKLMDTQTQYSINYNRI